MNTHMATTVKSKSPSLDSLHTEILYRILDHVDGQTIFSSLRYASKQLAAVTNTYNRYKLDFSSISKTNFRLACRTIRPENVISLILSDNGKTTGQISLFLSLVNINQWTRLRSVTLRDINDNDLQTLLFHITTSCTLISLSIVTGETESAETLTLFSSIITQPTLRQLEFRMVNVTSDKMQWPFNCTLNYLKVDNCTFEQFCTILDHSPNLRTIELRNGISDKIDENMSKSYPQLISLSLNDENIYRPFNDFQLILSLIPSLEYLKIIVLLSDRTHFDGSKWENIIMTRLPRLNRFEFFFSEYKVNNYHLVDLCSCMTRYRTPFWIEMKRWSVACTYEAAMHSMIVYSTPLCVTSISHISRYRKKPVCAPITIANFETDLRLLPKTSMATTTEKQNESSSLYWFENVTELTLEIDGKNLPDLFDLFPNSVDPLHLVKLSLAVQCYASSLRNTINNIVNLLERTYNIRWLSIFYRRSRTCSMVDVRRIYAILPRYIKDLTIEIITIDDIKLIFEQLEYLSSFTMVLSMFSMPSTVIIEWFKDNVNDFTHRVDGNRIYVWLGNYTKKRTEIKVGLKRVKLSHNS